MPITDTWTDPPALDLAIDDLYTETVHDGMVSDLLYLYNALFGVGARGLTSKRIGRVVVSTPVATITFSAIDQSYETLRLVMSVRGTNATQNVVVYGQVNGDVGTNYVTQTHIVDGGTQNQARLATQTAWEWLRAPAGVATANQFAFATVTLCGYARTDRRKGFVASGTGANGSVAAETHEAYAGAWGSTAAISQITLSCSAGNFAVGSVFSLYGDP